MREHATRPLTHLLTCPWCGGTPQYIHEDTPKGPRWAYIHWHRNGMTGVRCAGLRFRTLRDAQRDWQHEMVRVYGRLRDPHHADTSRIRYIITSRDGEEHVEPLHGGTFRGSEPEEGKEE